MDRLFSVAGICFFVFIIYLQIANNRESRENIDVLKNIDISRNSYLISPIISELHRITGERESNLRFPDVGGRMSLGNSFQKLQEAGKATAEEVEAIKEFEIALNNLSKAIQKLDSMSSLRREMRL